MIFSTQRRGLALTFGALLAIGYLTLTPAPTSPFSAESPWWCIWCGDLGLVDTLANVALFIPLGIGLHLLGMRPFHAGILVLVATGSIEGLQLHIVSGRDANLRDLLTNGIGGLLGYVLTPFGTSLLHPRPDRARIIMVVVSLSWALSRVATGVLLAPSPPAGTWFAQLAPKYVYPANLDGALRAPTVNQQPVRTGRLGRRGDITRPWRLDSIEVTATVELRSLPPRLASVVSVLSQQREEVFVLGIEGNDAVFRTRTRASDLRLRSPAIRLERAVLPGRDVRLTGGHVGHSLSLSSDVTLPHHVERRLSAGLTWALLSPFDIFLDSRSTWWSALLVGTAMAIVGWYAGLSRIDGRISPMLIALVLVLALALPPSLSLGAPAEWPEWLGGVLGGICGLGTAAVARHRVANSRGQGSSV